MIPVNAPLITGDAKTLVAKALSEGWISSAGPYVEKFEQAFAKYLGVKHAIAVNTGTAALHIALLSAGIGPGDEVIVPAFTMAASWMAVMYTGAKPVFVDVDPKTFTLDPSLIESALTSKTKAIMPVHIYGHPADLDPIVKLAKQHGLIVIEDAAEAHGATYRGQLVGGIGDINAFSFYANKIITTGEGGMVTTDNDALAVRARSLKDLSHSPQKRFIHDELGYNYRLTSLQAALGIGQLKHVQEFLDIKQHLAELYHQQLSVLPGLTLPIVRPWGTHVYWMYAILISEKQFGLNKDAFRAKLLEKGVDTRDFFYAPADQPVLQKAGLSGGSFPVTEQLAVTGCYLPSGLALTDDQISEVCETIKSICPKL